MKHRVEYHQDAEAGGSVMIGAEVSDNNNDPAFSIQVLDPVTGQHCCVALSPDETRAISKTIRSLLRQYGNGWLSPIRIDTNR